MFCPNIFANRYADSFAAHIKWFDAAGRFKITIFIEDIVSRQERLMRLADRFAALKQSGGIVKRFPASFVSVNETDEQSRVSHARMKLIEDLEILRNKTRFEDEVLRRVSGNGQFWRQDQFCPSSSETLVSADDLLKIAAQISDCRVNLSKTNLHPALEQTMRNTARSNPLLLRSMIRSNSDTRNS